MTTPEVQWQRMPDDYEQGWDDGRADMHEAFAIANAERDRYREAVAVALGKLEDEQCYGFPEFWDYLDEALAALSVEKLKVDNP